MSAHYVGNIIQAIRKSQGLSQYELALKAGTFQANISSIENGKTDPSLGTIDSCLAPLGYSLIAVPTRLPTIATMALDIQSELSRNKFDSAVRAAIQISDNLQGASRDIQVALTLQPPTLTSDPRFDALIAGICDHYLYSNQLPIPEWIVDPSRTLSTEWIVDRFEKSAERLRKETPERILRHGVLFSYKELMSI